MIKLVVLGGSGMLGSMVVDVFQRDPEFELTATVRTPVLASDFGARIPDVQWRLFDAASTTKDACVTAIAGAQWIINAVGITKPYAHDDNPDEVENAIRINSIFPYRLAAAAKETGARVLQIATDCVYSGQKGSYTESDPHDPLDVYGKTKSLGEVLHPGTHCLRCSIIGPEPKASVFLLEWFRRQMHSARVNGFTNHQWNGVTTLQFAKLCMGIIKNDIPLSHLQHVIPTGTISKYEMLQVFGKEFGRTDLQISPTEAKTVVDRTLSTTCEKRNCQLWAAAGYAHPPTVPEMIAELASFEYHFEGACA
jgi:dTDP-4-dehydrorhamnose reductase